MRRTFIFLAVAILAMTHHVSADDVPRPRLGLFVTREDVARARERCESEQWAREYRDNVIRIADEWLARSDEWIRDIMPEPGSKFAYGTAGCPHCGKSWGRFGSGVARFERPLALVCPHCDTEFDLKRPSGPYADHGDGVVVNGQRYWLHGVWNAFVVQQMWAAFDPGQQAITNLAEAYALTGDDRYARKAIVIMDALAALAPHTIGPRDFNPDPDHDAGRLQHLTSIVFRAQVHFARALDLLGNHSGLHQRSATNPEKTVWDNIRFGIFEEYLFKPIDTRGGKLHTLHNHEADSVRALLLAGLMYGEPDYLRWGATSVRAFLDNTIDRDGLYYETSLSYTNFTRGVFIDMAEMLVRYDPANYPAAANMPPRSELPFEGNYFNHPGLARLTLDMPRRVSVLGRAPTYGNNHFDTTVWTKPGRPFGRSQFQQAQRFMMYSTDDAIRRTATERVREMGLFAAQKPHGGWWGLFRAPDDAAAERSAGEGRRPKAISEPSDSDFFGQTGLMILRSGEDAERRAAVMRVGPNLPHAHDDQMALMLFGNGRALSGDIGYGIFGNHVHLGWATRAIAHNTVVVNQDETSDDKLFRMKAGGTIHRFYGGGDGLAWMEASMPQVFEPSDGVREYRRLVMQIDLSPQSSYWVDFFDIDGGRVHDYSFHAKPVGDKGSFEIRGAEPKAIEGAWTLAGLDPCWRGASFDEQGRAWGERLTVNGMVAKIPGVEDEVPEKGWWYATPGNGYGFLYNVRSADTTELWSATWRWQERGQSHGLRLTMLPGHAQRLVTAIGPTLSGREQMQWIIARHGVAGNSDASVRSRYVAVMEAFGGSGPAIDGVEPIRRGDRVVGVRVRAGEREDLILDARSAPIEGSADVPALDGGLAIVRRVNGKLEQLVLSGGSSISVDGVTLRFDTPVYRSTIAAVDDEAGAFRVDPPLPAEAVGATLLVNNKAYSHGSVYRIGEITSDGFIVPLDSEITLARAQVARRTDGGFVSTAPLVFGYEYDTSTGFLRGKRIVIGDGQTGRIVDMTSFKSILTEGIEPAGGTEFVVYDVQPGDTVEMNSTATVRRGADGAWSGRSNAHYVLTGVE